MARQHLVSVDAPDHLGRPRWQGQPGRLEVWYASVTDPASGDGYWLHHELVAGLDGAARAHGWLAVFPADAPPLVERFGPEPIRPEHLDETTWYEGGGARMGPGTMTGRTDRGSWDLAFADAHPPLFTFPEYVWQGSLLPASQVVPWPTAEVSGTIELDGYAVRLEEAPAGIARIYGRGNAHRWGWLHADLGGGDVLEIVAAQARRPGLRVVPPRVFCRIRVAGEDWPGDPLVAALTSRSRIGLPRWYATVLTPRRRLRVGVRLPPAETVTLEYRDPDDATARCTNSCRADAEIRLEQRSTRGWDLERSWSLAGTAHAEVGERP